MWNPPPGPGYPPQGGGAYPPQGGGAYPPQGGGAYPPPPGMSYAAAPPPQAYGGAPPGGGAYVAPMPGGMPSYGGAPPGAYGGPSSPAQAYGAPQQGYGGGAPQQGYGGGAPPGQAYGAPSPGYGGRAPDGQQSPSYGGGAGGALGGGGGAPGGYPQGPPPGAMVAAHCKQGRKKAVLIGINYIHGDPRSKLNGCINDAVNLRQFLIAHFGFPPQNIRILTDDQPTSSHDYPSKNNLLNAMQWLVEGVQAGDSLFFHFSGHGGQEKDKYHLEDDGLNETILPADYSTAGQIIDDKMHKIMVKPLREGMQFTAIFDSCHSGTALDLPFLYKASSKKYKNAHKQKGDSFWARHKVSLKDVPLSVAGVASTATSHVSKEVSHRTKKTIRDKISKHFNSSKAHVTMLSGCRDDQTSADTSAGGQACGAMSWAFRTALTQYQTQLTYEQLLQSMREILHEGPKQYTQIPQLSYANEDMDMSSVFSL